MAGNMLSFRFDCIRAIKEYAPEFHVGPLIRDITDETSAMDKDIGGEDICPMRNPSPQKK